MSQKKLDDVRPDVLDDLKRRVLEVARGLFENKLVVSTFGVVAPESPILTTC
jgi:hypothetical protein